MNLHSHTLYLYELHSEIIYNLVRN